MGPVIVTIEQKALLDVRATRSEVIHQLRFYFAALTEDNSTDITHTSCLGGVQKEVRIGAHIHHHHHPHHHHHHHHHHHQTSVTNTLHDQRLFTPGQSQEAPHWWFIVQGVMNSAVYIRKCLTEGLSALCCTHTYTHTHTHRPTHTQTPTHTLRVYHQGQVRTFHLHNINFSGFK